MPEAEDQPLSERLRALRLREAGEADEEAIRRALAEKQALYEKMQEAGLTAADVEPAHAPAPGEDHAHPPVRLSDRIDLIQQELQAGEDQDAYPIPRRGAPVKPRRRRGAVDWFLGRDWQGEGSGVVTRIPAYDTHVWEEVRFTRIEPPYSFVRILRHKQTQEHLYEVIEPTLRENEQEVLQFVEDALVRGLRVDPGELKESERLAYLMEAVRQILRDYMVRIDRTGQQRVEYYIRRDFLGLGPIHVMMKDQGLEDISCDGANEPLFVFHRDFESITSNVVFPTEAELDGYVIKLAQRSGKAISISDPILDAALPDGSRLQATLGREVTQNGSTFTIRRFKPDPFTPLDLVNFGTMDDAVLAWFWMIVQYGSSLIFSGGTASGKTTGLNAISQFIPPAAKIVSIEDTREVNLPHKNWIKSVTRSGASQEGSGEIGMFELLKAALRQRPEYILVGEVRGIEATVAFQAMATGHTVYATMHADSARSVVYRLENDPINIPRLVLQALDVIAIQAQVRRDGKRVRRIKEVVELVGMDPSTRELLTNTVFRWRPEDDTFVYGGRSYLLERVGAAQNWSSKRLDQEFERRKRLVRWLREGRRVDVQELGVIIRAYYRDGEALATMVDDGATVDDVLQREGRLEEGA